MRSASASASSCKRAGGTTRFTKPHASAVAASIGSPVKQHFHRALAADGARQRHHRRAAKESDPHARRGEGRVLRGDCQIAGCDELASRSGGNRANFCDHGLRNHYQTRHQGDAGFENRAIRVGIAVLQLAEIVSGRERRTFAAENRGTHVGVFTNRGEGSVERAHHRQRERVTPLGPLHRNGRDRAFAPDRNLAHATAGLGIALAFGDGLGFGDAPGTGVEVALGRGLGVALGDGVRIAHAGVLRSGSPRCKSARLCLP